MGKSLSESLIGNAFDNPRVAKYVKVGGIIISGIVAIYLVGYVFKIGAHTVNGFNEFKNALANGK